MPQQPLRVFISSKMRELAPEREAVKAALALLHIDAWVFEKDAGARPQNVQDTYLAEVEASDLYIGLFWKGYGGYTIEEYEEAQALGMDCLVYEKRDIATQRDPALQAFLDRIGGVTNEVTIKRFNTAAELGQSVAEDVQAWQAKIVRESRKRDSPGIFAGVPPLPANFVGRTEIVGRYARRLRANEDLAMEGWPGVGKTTLAVAVTRHLGVRRHFSDGVLWASLGPTPDVTAALLRWGEALKIDVMSRDTVTARAQLIADVIGARKILLVLDDVWHIEVANTLRCGGPNCCHLLTTRDKAIARGFAGAMRTDRLPALEDEAARELLQALAPEVCEAYPDEIRKTLTGIGGLPLAIRLIGGYLAAPEHSMFPDLSEEALVEMRDPRRRLALAERRLGDQSSPPMKLSQAIELSLHGLPDAVTKAFRALGAFAPMPARFSREAAEFVTQAPVSALAVLGSRNLLEIEQAGRQLALQQTIADVAHAGVDTAALVRHRDHYLGLLHQHEKDSWLIFDSFPQIKQAWESTPDDRSLLDWLSALYHYFARLHLWREYLAWADRALAVMLRLGMRREEGSLRANMAVARLYLDEWREALTESRMALAILQEVGDAIGAARALHNVGICHHALGEGTEALDTLEQSRAKLSEAGDTWGLAEALDIASAVYRELGNVADNVETSFEADLVRSRNGLQTADVSPSHIHLARTPMFIRQFRNTLLLAVFHRYVTDDVDPAGFTGQLVIGVRRESDGVWQYWQASFRETERATAQYVDQVPDQADAVMLYAERDEVEVLKRARSGNFEGMRGDSALFEKFLKRYVWRRTDEAKTAHREYGFGLFLVAEKNQPALAVERFDRAVMIQSELIAKGRDDISAALASSLYARGVARDMLPSWQQAILDFDKAIEIRTRLVAEGKLAAEELATSLDRRSVQLLRLARYADAVDDLGKVIQIRKRLTQDGENRDQTAAVLAGNLSHRGAALMVVSRFSEALQDLSEAIEIWTRSGDNALSNPPGRTLALVQEMRATALDNLGEHRRAAEAYQTAIHSFSLLAPSDANTPPVVRCLNGLAWLQATSADDAIRDGAKAVTNATRACQLTAWQDPALIDTLAAAFAETGDFVQAREWLTKALDTADKSQIPEFQARLDLYRQQIPYRALRSK